MNPTSSNQEARKRKLSLGGALRTFRLSKAMRRRSRDHIGDQDTNTVSTIDEYAVSPDAPTSPVPGNATVAAAAPPASAPMSIPPSQPQTAVASTAAAAAAASSPAPAPALPSRRPNRHPVPRNTSSSVEGTAAASCDDLTEVCRMLLQEKLLSEQISEELARSSDFNSQTSLAGRGTASVGDPLKNRTPATPLSPMTPMTPATPLTPASQPAAATPATAASLAANTQTVAPARRHPHAETEVEDGEDEQVMPLKTEYVETFKLQRFSLSETLTRWARASTQSLFGLCPPPDPIAPPEAEDDGPLTPVVLKDCICPSAPPPPSYRQHLNSATKRTVV